MSLLVRRVVLIVFVIWLLLPVITGQVTMPLPSLNMVIWIALVFLIARTLKILLLFAVAASYAGHPLPQACGRILCGSFGQQMQPLPTAGEYIVAIENQGKRLAGQVTLMGEKFLRTGSKEHAKMFFDAGERMSELFYACSKRESFWTTWIKGRTVVRYAQAMRQFSVSHECPKELQEPLLELAPKVGLWGYVCCAVVSRARKVIGFPQPEETKKEDAPPPA